MRSDRSLGTGFVVFESRQEAVAAKKQYDGMLLDEKPMVLKLADEVAASSGMLVQLSSGLRCDARRAW